MRERTGIFVLLILYGVGIVSLMVNDLRNVVLPLSPYTLLLSFLILMNSYRWKSPVVWVAILVFLLGFTAEWVGVQKGWLFGVYHYGSNLGPKLAGVPLIIGINWAMLTLATGAAAASMLKNRWAIVVVASLLMTGLDYLMEPVAVENGYWYWKDGKIPLYNYVCWFLVALLAQGINVGISKAKPNNTSWTLLLLLVLFFVIQFFF
ncbi:MAG: carotenoid biosynthesis protein [Flavobacteriia bacterium]|jgi:putative membrane protein|nr:carotenoid biosynthesis protein [Flavobacteriia bacterium]